MTLPPNPNEGGSSGGTTSTAPTAKDSVGHNPLNWADVVSRTILAELTAWGDANGESRLVMGNHWNTHGEALFDYIQNSIFRLANREQVQMRAIIGQEILSGHDPADFGVAGMGADWYTHTTEGLNRLLDLARDWFGGKTGINISSVSSGPARVGSGRRGPTPEDIRKQFDIEQLTRTVNDINRSLVLEEHSDPKAVAREYVDAVVASKGAQKIDFHTFVEQKIEATSRYKSIYRNKPEHLSARDHLAPYLQAASGVVSPDNAAAIAIGGAQFGASSSAFQERLRRTDENQTSAPFVSQLEGRLRDLNSLFKG